MSLLNSTHIHVKELRRGSCINWACEVLASMKKRLLYFNQLEVTFY